MAYTTINKSTDYFDTKIHDGTGVAKTLAYDFEVDMFWTKMRNGAYPNNVYDAVRGANEQIRTDVTNAVRISGDTVSFNNSSGVSLGADSGSYGTNKQYLDDGTTQATYVGWGWRANGAGVSNTDGDITSTVSANTTSGFSIVKYTGNGSNDQTVGHGLGARPVCWMIKRLDSAADWIVYHQGVASNWYDDTYFYLNENYSIMGSVNAGTGNPTSSVFYIGNDTRTGASGGEYIAYVFAEKTGFSKFGNYKSNNNVDGPFVYTGFKPEYIMIKSVRPNGYNWMIFDTVRQPLNLPNGVTLQADNSGVEFDYAPNGYVDFLSNGFKLRSTSNGVNGSGADDYIYCAFGQSIVGSNNVPANPR